MIFSNPFAAVAASIPPAYMQAYVFLMIAMVIVGTLADLLYKGSARYFFQQREKTRVAARRPLSSSETLALAGKTLAYEVAASGEFCNMNRRLSHLLMSYGFVIYLITTIVLVFAYPDQIHPPVPLPVLWHLSVAMVLAGGFWFFFFLRVNVAHDVQPMWRLVQADLFIVTLLASLSLAWAWSMLQSAGAGMAASLVFGLYIFFTTLLFVTVPWSKFAHMFYKPVVAFQRRIEFADGSTDLPTPAGKGGHRCPHSHT